MTPATRPSRGLGVATHHGSRPRETVLLATGLVAGLVIVAPTVGVLLGIAGLPARPSLAAGVAAASGLYALFVLIVDRVLLGTLVATVVTATFAIDVPLTPGASAYPGSLGPQLWLVYVPLFALVGLLAIRGAYTVGSLDRVEYALGAFVGWSVAVALAGPVPRTDVALYYSLFSLLGLVAYGVTARCVEAGIGSLRGVVGAFLVAVGGHVAFATVQLVNQGPIGLSAMGETARSTSHTVVGLGPLGEFNVGVFVSGFVGGSSALATVLVLAIPLTLAVAFRRAGSQRLWVLVAVIAMTAILRFTEKDAARGGALLGASLVSAYVLWGYRDQLSDRMVAARRAAPGTGLYLLALGVLFVPSSIQSDGSAGGPGGFDGAGDVGVSIPLFALNTLGVRIEQYVVGLELVAANPVTGVGGANFQYTAAAAVVPAIDGYAMHNLYLSLLVGTGIVGFVLYATALLLVLGAGVRLLRSGAADRLLVAGTLAGFVAFLAVLFWEHPLRITYALSFWLLAGALVGHLRAVVARGP